MVKQRFSDIVLTSHTAGCFLIGANFSFFRNILQAQQLYSLFIGLVTVVMILSLF